jgi:hypothetical protein
MGVRSNWMGIFLALIHEYNNKIITILKT